MRSCADPPAREDEGVTSQELAQQEETFARAFALRDLEIARPLYHPEVVYLSPTVRLYDWPARIAGIDRTLEFIALTIRSCGEIQYRAVEQAVLPTSSAFVRIHFDWTSHGRRLRSNYVVLYRYRDERIGQQELYYDPSGPLEELPPSESAKIRPR